jgi:predicted phosphodiesterase
MVILVDMRIRKRGPERKEPRKRRVSKPLAAVAIVFALGFLFVTSIKIHATWLLAEARTGWNAKELSKIDRSKTNFTFAVFGDTHDSSQAFGRIQKEINKGDYLFAIDVGDMAIDSGVVKERYFINQVQSMKTPVLTVVGNHDIAAGGYANYEKIYGPRYYSFTVGRCFFIVLDDADGVRVDAKQMDWFKQQLAESLKYPNSFVFMHVPTFRGKRDLNLPMQYFLQDRKNAEEIRQLCIDNRINIVFSAHCHTFDYDIWPNDVHYVVTGGGGGRLWDVEKYRGMYHYIKVTIQGGHGSFELEPINQNGLHFAYQYLEEPWVYIYAWSVGRYWLAVLLLLLGCAMFGMLALRRRREVVPEVEVIARLCPGCGLENEAGATACTDCGAAIPSAKVPAPATVGAAAEAPKRKFAGRLFTWRTLIAVILILLLIAAIILVLLFAVHGMNKGNLTRLDVTGIRRLADAVGRRVTSVSKNGATRGICS